MKWGRFELAMAPMFLTVNIGTKIGFGTKIGSLSQTSSRQHKNAGKERKPGGVYSISIFMSRDAKNEGLLTIRDGLLLAMPPLSDGRI